MSHFYVVSLWLLLYQEATLQRPSNPSNVKESQERKKNTQLLLSRKAFYSMPQLLWSLQGFIITLDENTASYRKNMKYKTCRYVKGEKCRQASSQGSRLENKPFVSLLLNQRAGLVVDLREMFHGVRQGEWVGESCVSCAARCRLWTQTNLSPLTESKWPVKMFLGQFMGKVLKLWNGSIFFLPDASYSVYHPKKKYFIIVLIGGISRILLKNKT